MDKQNICKYCGQVLMTDVECDCPEAKKSKKNRGPYPKSEDGSDGNVWRTKQKGRI